jgi:predicted TIM-barrel fold metal-dependent hydrolase
MAALIIHGVFQRFPNVRVCSIENGSDWVATLLRKLKKAERMNVRAFHQPPVEVFRRHVSVAPYYEEDVASLAEAIGIENVLLGSDFPHAEGLADPLSFLDELEGFAPADVRLVMRENGLRLVQPRPASRA